MWSEDSDHSCYSDAIDSDIEVNLYGLLHHDVSQHDVLRDHSDSPAVDNLINGNSFRHSSHILKADTNEGYDSETIASETRDDNEIECIDICDTTSDSDESVVIVNDGLTDRLTDGRQRSSRKEPNVETLSPNMCPNLMLSNVNNLRESTLELMDKYYNEDVYETDDEERAKNNMADDRSLWQININDMFLDKGKNKRYYRSGVFCHNCSERGHISRDCKQKKKCLVCYLCGNNGHRGERCTSKICFKCNSTKHGTNNCNVYVNHLTCSECGLKGHEQHNCTYNWRKYHLTTTSVSEPLIDNLKVNKTICCYNCGAYGKHFGHECRSKNVINYVYLSPPSPLMPTTKKSHYFNDRQRISSHDSSHSIGNILSKQLVSGSASFTSLSPSHQSARKNKHIKWCYPETNIALSSNGETSVIEEQIFNDSSPIIHNCIPIASNPAHTHSPTHAQIDNPMLANRQTPTPKRSKRKKKLSRNLERLELLDQTNESPNRRQKTSISKKKKTNIRSINRRLKKKFAKYNNNSNHIA